MHHKVLLHRLGTRERTVPDARPWIWRLRRSETQLAQRRLGEWNSLEGEVEEVIIEGLTLKSSYLTMLGIYHRCDLCGQIVLLDFVADEPAIRLV